MVIEAERDLFYDERDGGWFSTTGQDASVLLRVKEDYDGAEPAAASGDAISTVKPSGRGVPKRPSVTSATKSANPKADKTWPIRDNERNPCPPRKPS